MKHAIAGLLVGIIILSGCKTRTHNDSAETSSSGSSCPSQKVRVVHGTVLLDLKIEPKDSAGSYQQIMKGEQVCYLGADPHYGNYVYVFAIKNNHEGFVDRRFLRMPNQQETQAESATGLAAMHNCSLEQTRWVVNVDKAKTVEMRADRSNTAAVIKTLKHCERVCYFNESSKDTDKVWAHVYGEGFTHKGFVTRADLRLEQDAAKFCAGK